MSDDKMTTKPTIDTLLTRLDEWGTRFTNQLSDVRVGQEELAAGQTELRQSVEELGKGQERLTAGQEQLTKGQDQLTKGQEELRTDLNTGLRRVERKIEILNDNLLTINADIRDLEVRVEKLESPSVVKS